MEVMARRAFDTSWSCVLCLLWCAGGLRSSLVSKSQTVM